MAPTLIQIILLGIVQGAAELLPVSSSAHVIAAEKLMRLDPSRPEMTFLIVMLHTGTMFATVLYFWKSWSRSFFSSAAAFRGAVVKVGLATVATALIYGVLSTLAKKVLLHGASGAEVESLFSNLPLMAASLAVAGALIIFAGLRSPPVPADAPATEVPTTKAVWMGAVQGVCLPFRGLSRSGATISTGMLLGVPKRAAEEFSFALAIVITPPALAVELHRLYKARAAGSAPVDIGALLQPGLVGMVFSFGAGLLALKWLSGWLENGKWHYFGIYCLIAAACVAAMAALGY
jgi:undecaprenyl-diphosphatase